MVTKEYASYGRFGILPFALAMVKDSFKIDVQSTQVHDEDQFLIRLCLLFLIKLIKINKSLSIFLILVFSFWR